MSLWSTIKSAVSSLFKKEDDKKSSSSSTSKTATKASKPTTSNKSAIGINAPKNNQGTVTKASKPTTSNKPTTSSSKTTTNTKTSTASTPKITTTGSKGFREIEAASTKSTSSSRSAAKSTSSSSSGVPTHPSIKDIQLLTQQTLGFKGLFELSSSSSSSDSSEPEKPKFNVYPQYNIFKTQDTKTLPKLQLPAFTQSTLAKESIASTLPGAEDATKPRETYTEDNRHSWTTYKVNTAQVSDAERINKGLSDGSIEIWNVVKGDAFKTEAKYAEGVTEIGRERLDGLTDKDRVVYYDTKTGKIYKLAQGSEDYNNAQRKAQTYAGLIETLDNNKSKAVDAYIS